MNRLLVICGPNATGKTGLGISLAKKFNGEVVSADSRQVYRGMDIGTGKDIQNFQFSLACQPGQAIFPGLPARAGNLQSISNLKFQIGHYLIDGCKVWLYDTVNPDYQFNAADYVKCAKAVIEDIWERGKLPILVGGTGFYIKAVVDGIETLGVPPDWKLRNKLSGYSVFWLSGYFKRLDYERWEKMNQSDRRNSRRLIRAIEIANFENKNVKIKKKNDIEKFKNVLFIGLTVPFKTLYLRIDERVDKRVAQGIEKEIRGLLKKGFTFENSAMGITIGYKEWQSKIENEELKKEVIRRWKYDEHSYARRQMTWFKKDKRIHWFDILKSAFPKQVELLVEKMV